jgi:two-component system, LytTR family, sensor kinase
MEKQSFIRQKGVTYFLHLLVWVALFSLPLLTTPQQISAEQLQRIQKYNGFLLNPAFILFFVGSFYLNAYLLFPKFVSAKGQIWLYLIFQAIIITALIVLVNQVFFDTYPPRADELANRPARRPPYLTFTYLYLFILAGSSTYCLINERIDTNRKQREKENESLKAELLFLRNQISPHFLFNVLNNMVSLARLKSNQLEPSLIELSGLMRYMLYESNEQKVILEKEINYLQSYISLQEMRFTDTVEIQTNISIEKPKVLIEPMLLIPFVENAFKHGVGLIDDPEIIITLLQQENQLVFTVKNRYSDTSIETRDKSSGIGLTNVKRRLDLLYLNLYQLELTKKEGWFIASLNLTLQ